MNQNNINKSKRFWIYFWTTIIVIATIFIVVNITASKKLNDMNIDERKEKLEPILKDFKKHYPKFIKMTNYLNQKAIKQIRSLIDTQIDIAYKPLYKQIDNLSDFHYSVKGEYAELWTILFGKIEDILKEKLFNPVEFNLKLHKALQTINNESLGIVQKQLVKMKIQIQIQSDIDLNKDEINFLFTNILKLTQKDIKSRFSNYNNNIFKGMGLGIGTGASVVMTKIISKKIATVISKKIVTKATIKGGAKLTGASVGAITGLSSGLLCGPVAWLCSPTAGIIGGITGWFATDKIVVELDKHYNQKEFKKDIKILIDKQKQSTKNSLYVVYTKSFNKLSDTNKNILENIKSKSIKTLIE